MPGKQFWVSVAVRFMIALFAMPASAQTLFPIQTQPDGLDWPVQGWETAEMPAETAAIVKPLIAETMAKNLGDVMGETRAIVIIYKGRLVAESYRKDFGPETKQISWSMAKSLTQALVGRALQLGLIEDIDTPMPTPFEPNDPRSQITWRQWLNMTDGLEYYEIDAPGKPTDSDVVQMMFGKGRFDVLRYIRDELPPLHEPGTHWNYSTAGFHLIGKTFSFFGQEECFQCAYQVSMECGKRHYPKYPQQGSNDDDCRQEAMRASQSATEDWIQGALFTPLGMDAQPEFDASGTFLGGSLIWASARDFAKFGYLYLRGGVWQGEQLLPEGWVDFARTETPADNANIYGAGWWITAYGEKRTHPHSAAATPPWDAFHAGGHEGQTIWVVPSRDLVIVRLGLMGNGGDNWPALFEWNQQIARAFPEVTE